MSEDQSSFTFPLGADLSVIGLTFLHPEQAYRESVEIDRRYQAERGFPPWPDPEHFRNWITHIRWGFTEAFLWV